MSHIERRDFSDCLAKNHGCVIKTGKLDCFFRWNHGSERSQPWNSLNPILSIC